MRILTVLTNSGAGGATKACIRLHEHFNNSMQVESSLLMLETPSNNISNAFGFYDFYIKNQKPKSLIQRFWQIIRNRLDLSEESRIHKKINYENKLLSEKKVGIEVFTFDTSLYDITSHPAYKEADIVHFHWVANNFIDYERFFSINTKPVVWTLHDMNPFTGGCHYSDKCLLFQKDCSECHQLLGTSNSNYTKEVLARRINAIHNASCSINIVSPSLWLLNLSQSSKMFEKLAHFHIPYGINEDIFKPRDKNFARDLFGIPKDKIIILFVAVSLASTRKGYKYLKEALSELSSKDANIELCSIGAKQHYNNAEAHFPIYELGSFQDEHSLSLIYSMADIFVIPSLEDNLPNTVIESLLCGTPVVGFDVGGIRDMVNESNGALCKTINSSALADTIQETLSRLATIDRSKIREDAVRKYSLPVQENKYIGLYKDLCKQNS